MMRGALPLGGYSDARHRGRQAVNHMNLQEACYRRESMFNGNTQPICSGDDIKCVMQALAVAARHIILNNLRMRIPGPGK